MLRLGFVTITIKGAFRHLQTRVHQMCTEEIGHILPSAVDSDPQSFGTFDRVWIWNCCSGVPGTHQYFLYINTGYRFLKI
jgi:hypothetical protein